MLVRHGMRLTSAETLRLRLCAEMAQNSPHIQRYVFIYSVLSSVKH